MMSTGILSLLFPVIMAAGLAGVPLAMPPLPEDPLLAKLAPEECLWYLSSAGVAAPDSGSKNATERLLAEPELQELYSKIELQVLSMIRAQGRGREDEAALAAETAKVIRVVATRPLSIYIGKVKLGGEKGPQADAGIVVNLGENSAEIEKALRGLEKLITQGMEPETYEEGGVIWRQLSFPPPTPPVAWSLRGKYLVIGIGEKVGPAILARARNNPPKWLTDLKSRLPVERVSVISYLNVAGARELAGPFLLAPPANVLVKSFGADRIQAVVSVSGLDAKGCVSQTLVQLDKSKAELTGLLALTGSEPLKPDDVSHIPADATIAAVLRLDSTKVWNWVVELASQIEPSSQKDVNDVLAVISQVTGADLKSEILPALGDVWSIHSSPADGSFPWTGAVASVSVKDHATLEKVNAKLVSFARSNMPDPPEDGRRHYATLRSSKVGEETIYFLNIVERDMPFAPAWCLTEDRLIVGLYPQSVKGALSLDSADKRLNDVAEVAAQFSGSSAPTGLTYVDTKTIFRTIYPALQIGVQLAASEWQREGLRLDVSVLPPARTIERHLQPTVMTFNRASDGFEFKRRQTLPGVSVTGVAPLLAGLLVPALGSARVASSETHDMNSMKQFLLALHNFHDINRSFPPAQWGTKGNKGLSWRVAILPFIEENALYAQFHHDEPWDSEHNLKLIEKMPAIYRGAANGPARAVAVVTNEKVKPADKVDELKYEAYRTPYVTLRHADSVFPPDEEKGLGMAKITDGTSKTIAIVRVAPENAVIWTKPDDLNFDPEKPLAGLVGRAGTILAGFCDGHVQRLTPNPGSEETIKALMTRSGGDAIDMRKLDAR